MSDILSGLAIPILGRAPRAPKATAQTVKSAGASRDSTPRREAAARGTSPAARNPLQNYHPRARVKYLHSQYCNCCGRVTEYVAADLVEYATGDKICGVATIRTRAWQAPDAQFSGLPVRLEYLTPDRIAACGECLRLERAFSLAAEGRGQLPLALDATEAAAPHSRLGAKAPAATEAATAHKAHILPAGTVRAAKARKALVVPLGDFVSGPRD